jgi:uncharacterized protein Yka (UPF0111/DUF47 family)
MARASFLAFLARDDDFYVPLKRQADAAEGCAKALHEYSVRSTSAGGTRETLASLQSESDAAARQLEDELSATLVTPIDREDLHSISSELSGVVPPMRRAVLDAAPTDAVRVLSETLVRSTVTLDEAMTSLREQRYDRLVTTARALRLNHREARTSYLEGLAVLLDANDVAAPKLAAALQAHVMLEEVLGSIGRCHAVGQVLLGLAMKHA